MSKGLLGMAAMVGLGALPVLVTGGRAHAAMLTPSPDAIARVQVACTRSTIYANGIVFVEYGLEVDGQHWSQSNEPPWADAVGQFAGLDVEPCQVGDLYDLVLWPRAGDATWGVYDGWMRCGGGSWNMSEYDDARWPSVNGTVNFLGLGQGCTPYSDWAHIRIEQRTSSAETLGPQVKARRR